MLKRIIFGVVGVVYLIAMFRVGSWFFNLSTALFALIGTRELYAALEKKGLNPVSWLGYLFIPVFFFVQISCGTALAFLAIIFGIMTALALPIFDPSIRLEDTALTVLGFFYPGVLMFFIIMLYTYVPPYHHYLLILTLVATFATDTFAYFTGMAVGRHKLCPAISPKKTIEGSIGGLAGSIMAAFLIGLYFTRVLNIHISLLHVCIIGLLSGVFSQLGDLSASGIKRYCGMKDFGNVLPGHGGILDRFDSLLFTAPVVYGYYLFFLAP